MYCICTACKWKYTLIINPNDIATLQMMFKLLPILFASAFAGLSDKDSRCRFRLHYPGASWHTAYDVCAKENKTLARVTFGKLNIMKMVLDEVDRLTVHINETDEMWIRGFFRPFDNESMDENCRSIDPEIGINVRNTEEPGISCLYYNKTDKQLHTGNCSSPKPFLCERKTQVFELINGSKHGFVRLKSVGHVCTVLLRGWFFSSPVVYQSTVNAAYGNTMDVLSYHILRQNGHITLEFYLF